MKILPFKVPDLNRIDDRSLVAPAYGLPTLTMLGAIRPKRGVDIASAPWGVGFEMLDRFAFDPVRAVPPLADLGATWARIQSGWNRCETVKGQYDFRWLDAVVDSLSAIGVTPWMSVCYGNKRLYTPDAVWEGVGGVPLYYGPAVRRAWVAYVRALARHFKDRIRYWEIWNEPNTQGYWPFDVCRADDYAALVKLTAPVIRREVENAVIIGGATSGIDFDFTFRAIQAGLLQHIDRFSVHPYGPIPEQTLAPIRCLRQMLNRHGGRNIGLWQGECGMPSRVDLRSRKAQRSNEHVQAKFLLRRMLCDFSAGMEVIQYFHLCDTHDRRKSPTPDRLSVGALGLLDTLEDYRPKRAYHAYQVLCALFDGGTVLDETGFCEPFSLELRSHLESVGSVCRVFARRDLPMLMYYCPENPQLDNPARTVWLRFRTERPIERPVLIDPVFNRVYRLPEPEPFSRGVSFWRDLPMTDYPLLIAGRRAVRDVLHPGTDLRRAAGKGSRGQVKETRE